MRINITKAIYPPYLYGAYSRTCVIHVPVSRGYFPCDLFPYRSSHMLTDMIAQENVFALYFGAWDSHVLIQQKQGLYCVPSTFKKILTARDTTFLYRPHVGLSMVSRIRPMCHICSIRKTTCKRRSLLKEFFATAGLTTTTALPIGPTWRGSPPATHIQPSGWTPMRVFTACADQIFPNLYDNRMIPLNSTETCKGFPTLHFPCHISYR